MRKAIVRYQAILLPHDGNKGRSEYITTTVYNCCSAKTAYALFIDQFSRKLEKTWKVEEWQRRNGCILTQIIDSFGTRRTLVINNIKIIRLY